MTAPRWFDGLTETGRTVHAVRNDGVDYNSVAACGVDCNRVERNDGREFGTTARYSYPHGQLTVCVTCRRLAK